MSSSYGDYLSQVTNLINSHSKSFDSQNSQG